MITSKLLNPQEEKGIKKKKKSEKERDKPQQLERSSYGPTITYFALLI